MSRITGPTVPWKGAAHSLSRGALGRWLIIRRPSEALLLWLEAGVAALAVAAGLPAVVDPTVFNNAAGWGPMLAANVPPDLVPRGQHRHGPEDGNQRGRDAGLGHSVSRRTAYTAGSLPVS
jgi:hypothetical protein